MIVPPEEEVPREVTDYLADKPDLMAVRRCNVADGWTFRMVSRRTLEPVDLTMAEYTASDLSYLAVPGSERGWYNGKAIVLDTQIHAEADDQKYLPPDGFEPRW